MVGLKSCPISSGSILATCSAPCLSRFARVSCTSLDLTISLKAFSISLASPMFMGRLSAGGSSSAGGCSCGPCCETAAVLLKAPLASFAAAAETFICPALAPKSAPSGNFRCLSTSSEMVRTSGCLSLTAASNCGNPWPSMLKPLAFIAPFQAVARMRAKPWRFLKAPQSRARRLSRAFWKSGLMEAVLRDSSRAFASSTESSRCGRALFGRAAGADS
mmetsp:Transcript_43653/g.139050  ORF Transcript_43653/g.139050 Transcript_43653/m.139050 type:complete len:218 (-) Transcript_43653:227-880(-)